MDKFQVGDKVCFLNDKGAGIITKIIDSKMVMVDTDGFEIPFMTSDLVLDRRSQPQNRQTTDTIQKEVLQKENTIEKASEDARRGNLRRFAANAEEEGIYLAFVPHDQQWLQRLFWQSRPHFRHLRPPTHSRQRPETARLGWLSSRMPSCCKPV